MADKFDIRVEGIARTKRRFDPKNVNKATFNTMQEFGIKWEREAKLNLSGKILHVITGNYRSHVIVSTEANKNGKGVTTTLQTQGVPYAEIHETGSDIMPKREPIGIALKVSLKSLNKIFAVNIDKEYNRARP